MRRALPGPEKSDYAALIRPTDCRSIEVRPTDCRSIEVRPTDCRSIEVRPTDCRSIEVRPLPKHRGPSYGLPKHRGPSYGLPKHRGPSYGLPKHRGPSYGLPEHRAVLRTAGASRSVLRTAEASRSVLRTAEASRSVLRTAGASRSVLTPSVKWPWATRQSPAAIVASIRRHSGTRRPCLRRGGEYVPAPVTALFQSGARESLGRHGRRPKALGTPRLQSWTRGELTLMLRLDDRVRLHERRVEHPTGHVDGARAPANGRSRA